MVVLLHCDSKAKRVGADQISMRSPAVHVYGGLVAVVVVDWAIGRLGDGEDEKRLVQYYSRDIESCLTRQTSRV
jgi:hypothetical protein